MRLEPPFPRGGRRLALYWLSDPGGVVDDYVIYQLEHLKPFVEQIIVLADTVTAEGRSQLAEVVDDVWSDLGAVHEIWAYKLGVERLGPSTLDEYDELLLVNDDWFGPVRPLATLFARMEAIEADLWDLYPHIIAARRRTFISAGWARYWANMQRPAGEAAAETEKRGMRSVFVAQGRGWAEAYPSVLDGEPPLAAPLIAVGHPALDRSTLRANPLELDRDAIVGRWLLDEALAEGYPEDLIWKHLARVTPPKDLNTNGALLEILPDVDLGYDASRPFRIAVTMHVFYVDMIDELMDRASMLPGSYDVFITTTDAQKAAVIESALAARADPRVDIAEVRVLPSNRGRDLSAFFIGVRDVLVEGGYDLIVKIHSKKTVQDGATIGEFFKRQQIDNLLGSPAYVANVLRLFQEHRSLGIVFAPTVHIGHPTLGGAWWTNKPPAEELFRRLGIDIPLDDVSPLGPMGAMWIARPEAMLPLTREQWSYEEYQPATSHGDGSLAHVQERAMSYAAAQMGYHTRTVAGTEYAAISHTFLEFKLDQLSQPVQALAIDAVARVRQQSVAARELSGGGRIGFLKQYVKRQHPGAVGRLAAVYRPLRGVIRRFRSGG